MNLITLQFDPIITRLAGHDYGKEIFEHQVRNQIDFTDGIIIKFQDQIVKIASSFVQGFFEEIIDRVGFEAIGQQVKIETGNEMLTKSVFDNLI